MLLFHISGSFRRSLSFGVSLRLQRQERLVRAALQQRCWSSSNIDKYNDGDCDTGYSCSIYDTGSSDNWRGWFSPVEYCNPWEQQRRSTRSSSDDGVVEHQTESLLVQVRYLIQLLQELHSAGFPYETHDRVTTERCNHIIHQLLILVQQQSKTKKKNKDDDNDSSDNNPLQQDSYLHAPHQAADALLRVMQLFEKNDLQQHHQQQQQHDIRSTALPFELPIPTRETYQLVLQLYACGGLTSRDDPERAHQIVESMQQRYLQYGDIEWKPHAFHWNSALKAYNNVPEKEEATIVEAAKVFLNENFKRDTSSFVIMMQICAHNHPNDQTALLGAHVGIKIWQEVIERQQRDDGGDNNNQNNLPNLSSHAYAFFLQAIRALPHNNALREKYYQLCMDHAIQYGKINSVIWNEFIVHNVSPKLFELYLHSYKHHIHGMSPSHASQVLTQVTPAQWSANADHPTSISTTSSKEKGKYHSPSSLK